MENILWIILHVHRLEILQKILWNVELFTFLESLFEVVLWKFPEKISRVLNFDLLLKKELHILNTFIKIHQWL